MFKHILVPTDGDPGSRRAIEWAIELARSCGARITGFHAMTELARTGIVDELLEPPPEELKVLAWAHADKLLAMVERKAERANVPCDTQSERTEHPWQAIVAAAKANHCDLIVMASHGRRGLAKLVLGSQTQQVLTHTSIPVLVVH
jgi:nucleotide-binding universal stress UspA family protein